LEEKSKLKSKYESDTTTQSWQSIWLDNITRDLLNNGRLKSYLDELSVTGLTSNPTIFDQAIKNSRPTTLRFSTGLEKGRSAKSLFDLALDDLTKAADLFRTILIERTEWMVGCRWKSRRCWRVTRPKPSQPPGNCPPGQAGQTFSSRFLEHPKDYRPSRTRFSLVCRSM
jgi:hypothetical protein